MLNAMVFVILPLVLLPLFIHKPEWGLMAIFGLAIFFREGWHPDFQQAWTLYNVNFLNIRLMEALLYLLFAVVLINRTVVGNKKIWLPPYTGMLMIFCLLMLFSVLYGFMQGAPVKAAFGYGEWRALFMCCWLFIFIPNIFDTREKIEKFIKFVYILAVVRLILGLVVYGLGMSTRHPTLEMKIIFWDSGENIFYSILVVIILCQLLFQRPMTFSLWCKGFWGLVMTYAIVSSLRRSYWLFLGGSILAVLYFSSLKHKVRLLITGAVSFILLLIVFLIASGGTGFRQVASRATSLLTSQGDTNSFHLYDISDAFTSINETPWLGVGFGNGFRRLKTLYGVGAEDIPPNIVHNIYLHIWLKQGIGGLMAFLLFWIFFSFYGIQGIKKVTHPRDKPIIIAMCSVIVGMVILFFWGSDLFANTRNPLFLFTFLSLLPALTHLNLQPATTSHPASSPRSSVKKKRL